MNPHKPSLVALSRALPALLSWMAAVACTSDSSPGPASPSVSSAPTATVSVGSRPRGDRYRVAGLEGAAEILVDKWGVAHITAERLHDLYVAQGFNAARDRLWQLDLWKRRGEGRLAEVLGEAFVEQDRAARLFLYRGDMPAEWQSYGPDTQRIARAFVAGINAYIELTEQHDALLPPEFKLLDYRPARWEPETIVRIRSHGLAQNASSEVGRARFLCAFGRDQLAAWDRLEPKHEVQIPTGLNPCGVPPRVLRDLDLARSPVLFPLASGRKLGALPRRSRDLRAGAGSNAWAVAPSRTRTQRPLLASDPHRELRVPALRYVVHLSAPGLDVIGAGEPALPGISMGHNGSVAFGLTIFGIDQEDLYVYETRPGHSTEYRYQDRWEPMTRVTETIAVRGQPPRSVTLWFSRHGPIVFEDRAARTAFALRASWLEPGAAPYLGGIALMRSRTAAELVAATSHWRAPAENVVYADVTGAIGWKPAGLAPVRPDWDGLLPVPGDGRFEWDGFLPAAEFPGEANPERGWIASANEMNLPDGYPHAIGYEWLSPFRYQRIAEVLSQARGVSVREMAELQSDTVSLPARRLVKLLADVETTKPGVRRAVELLLKWDRSLAADSAAAALFELWYRRHLGHELVSRLVDDPRLLLALGGAQPQLRLELLERPDRRLGGDPRAVRDSILVDSLEAAVRDATSLLGSEWTSWRWGKLLRAHLEHPLGEQLGPGQRGRWDVGPEARGGSGDTVCNSGYSLGDFRQQLGASFRMVLDVGAWDQSLAVNSPGQSGEPTSKHYRDLFPLWSAGGSFPLLYTREAVVAAGEQRIALEPAP